eukprot:Em0035g9a
MHSVTAHGKAHSPDDSAISTELATSKGARQHPSKSKSSARKRRRTRSTSPASSSTSSSSDSSSSSSSSESSSSESSDSDARRKKRKSKSKRHKRHHHSKSRDRRCLNAPFTTMVPTPSRREVKRIKKASLKYDKLFRQAAARDNQQALRWDVLKEDLLGHQHSTQQPLLAAVTMVSTPHIQHQVLGHWLQWRALCQVLPPHQHSRGYTPLRRLAFERELKGHPDKAWVSWLLNGIDNGVSTGYNGPHFPFTARNLTSALQHPEIVDAELLKEVELGRILGPFSQRPLEHLRTSGLGAVPKKNGKWRVILHLSAPECRSINDFIAKEEFSIHYSTIADAVALLSRFSKGARMAKVDLKSAFRMVPIQASEWELLGMYWRGQYYIDTCLPFGLRSAPNIFDNFASALHWVLENNYGAILLHYLDDFLLVDPPNQPTCQESMSTMLQKLQNISSLIKSWLGKCKATKRELLSLIGKLSFAAKVVPAGRLFLRRLIQLSTTVRKLHHHIHLNPEARADLRWWNSFLPSWNGISMFIAPEWKDADSFQLYTDASGSFGFGAYLDGAWFRGDWQPHQQLLKRSIQWQELFAIVAAALTWGHFLTGQRIRFHCDNLPIVQAWTNQSSRHPGIMDLLRTLFFIAARNNFTVSLVHLPGRLNCIADALSRNQMSRFFSLAPQANQLPTPGPSTPSISLLPISAKYSRLTPLRCTWQPSAHLHLTRGFSSPAHNNPTLNLAIRGMQRSQGPAHLRPKRLPLTIGMLKQLLKLLNSDPLSSHDKLMLKAALTFDFFGFLRVSEYTRTTRGRFDPRLHPTKSDVTWVKEGLHFLIKKSKTDQTGRGTMISMGYTHRASCPVMALRAYFQNCTAPPRAALFHFHTGRPLTSRAILKDLLLRGGYITSQYNTHSLRIGAATAAAQAGLPPSTIQRLGRWSSAAYTTYTWHPLTSPSDTATVASAP